MMVTRLFWVFLGALALGCAASTDVGNPITAEVEFAGYKSQSPSGSALTLDNGLVVKKAYIKVRSFRLDESANCDDTASDFDGVILVDLLSQVSSNSALWDGESGTFCRLRVQFTTDSVANEPAELESHSLYVSGTLPNGQPFEAQIAAEDTLSLEGDFTLPPGSHLLQVGFFMSEWFVSANSESGHVFDSDPVVDNNHPDYEDVRSNILKSARLFHDSDENGKLDTDEIARSLAVGN